MVNYSTDVPSVMYNSKRHSCTRECSFIELLLLLLSVPCFRRNRRCNLSVWRRM